MFLNFEDFCSPASLASISPVWLYLNVHWELKDYVNLIVFQLQPVVVIISEFNKHIEKKHVSFLTAGGVKPYILIHF